MAYIKFRKDLYKTSNDAHDRDVLRYQLQYILQSKKIKDDYVENTWFNGVRQDSIDNMIYDLSMPIIFREYKGMRTLKREYSEFVISWKKGDIEQEKVIDVANEIVRDFLTEYDQEGNVVFDGKDAIYMMASHLDQVNGNPHVHVICSKVNPLTLQTFDCLMHKDRVVRLKDAADRICKQHDLKVLDAPLYSSIGKSMSWEEYQARRHNRSFKGQIEAVIEEGINKVSSFEELISYLKQNLDVDENSLSGNPNYIKMRIPGAQVYTRLRALSIDYKYSSIMDRLSSKRVLSTLLEEDGKSVVTTLLDSQNKNPKYINVMDEKIANSPGLRKWADSQNLKTAAAALRATNAIEESGETIESLKIKKKDLQVLLSDKDYLLNELNDKRGKLVSLKKTLEIEWKINIVPVISEYKKIVDSEAKNAFKRKNYKYFKQFDSIKKLASELNVDAKKTDDSIVKITEEIKKIEYEYHNLYNERKDLNNQIQKINTLLAPTQYSTDVTKNKSKSRDKTKQANKDER